MNNDTTTTTTTTTTSSSTVKFFGLNGWAVSDGKHVLSPQFRTEGEALKWHETMKK